VLPGEVRRRAAVLRDFQQNFDLPLDEIPSCHSLFIETFSPARYHWVVRKLLILFLIAVLPLCGWSAQRMATGMAISQFSTSQGGMPADCPMVAKVAATSEKSTDHSTYGDSGHRLNCQTCQLCMFFAMPVTPTVPIVAPQPSTANTLLVDRFASADLARLAKPPIS
jgi:hypothetical protein